MNIYNYEQPIAGLWSDHIHISVLAETVEQSKEILKNYVTKNGMEYVPDLNPVEVIISPGVVYAMPYSERVINGCNAIPSSVYLHSV